jgi:hypothetical protein
MAIPIQTTETPVYNYTAPAGTATAAITTLYVESDEFLWPAYDSMVNKLRAGMKCGGEREGWRPGAPPHVAAYC